MHRWEKLSTLVQRSFLEQFLELHKGLLLVWYIWIKKKKIKLFFFLDQVHSIETIICSTHLHMHVFLLCLWLSIRKIIIILGSKNGFSIYFNALQRKDMGTKDKINCLHFYHCKIDIWKASDFPFSRNHMQMKLENIQKQMTIFLTRENETKASWIKTKCFLDCLRITSSFISLSSCYFLPSSRQCSCFSYQVH